MRWSTSASILTLYLLPAASFAAAATTSPDPRLMAQLAQIRDAAMNSDWAYQRLADLTDTVGPRLSGSVQLEAAIEQVAGVMKALGAEVTLQPAKVPHWVRGEARAKLIDYAGQTHGLQPALQLLALGGSSATPAAGLNARVVVVHNFAELEARAAEVRGSIVLYEARYDQRLADNGHAMDAYGQDGIYRFEGPARAAKLGASAALVRSVGGAEYRLAHTGTTLWPKDQAPIPAAALAAEDADLIDRLAARGPVRMQLLLTPQTLPDADSYNVIADLRGTEHPDEYVIVSGHLDSWDPGTGAIDDGVGVLGAAGVLAVLRQLDLHPKRTIRFVAWTNEENGGRGGKAYFESVRNQLADQCAAIESDSGAGRALGIYAAATKDAAAVLQPVLDTLQPIGATALSLSDEDVGSDIASLHEAGVPALSPMVDTRHYFDYHHTAADTLDKVDPVNLRSQVATMAVLAYYLAGQPCLPRTR